MATGELLIGVAGFGLGYIVGTSMTGKVLTENTEHAKIAKRIAIDVSGYITKSRCTNRLYKVAGVGVPYSIYEVLQVGIDPEAYICIYKISDPNNYAVEVSRASWNTLEIYIDGKIVSTMPMVQLNQTTSLGYYTDVLSL